LIDESPADDLSRASGRCFIVIRRRSFFQLTDLPGQVMVRERMMLNIRLTLQRGEMRNVRHWDGVFAALRSCDPFAFAGPPAVLAKIV
jgi:hypothetical protein